MPSRRTEAEQIQYNGFAAAKANGNSGAAYAIDVAAATTHTVILNANAVTLTITNSGQALPPGARLNVCAIQDGTGGRVLTFGTGFRNGPALTGSGANARALCEFAYDGVAWQFTGGATTFA